MADFNMMHGYIEPQIARLCSGNLFGSWMR